VREDGKSGRISTAGNMRTGDATVHQLGATDESPQTFCLISANGKSCLEYLLCPVVSPAT